MRAAAKLIALAAAASAMAAVAGCSPAAPRSQLGPAGFWTRTRMTGASPLHGPGYHALPAPGQTPSAHATLLALRVGALFLQSADGNHFCTASVISSPQRNLLITAAHCINNGNGNGYAKNIVFVPDYSNGQAPYGIWTVRKLLVAPQWASSSDPSLDVGFVVLASHDGHNIQDVLGANRLGLDKTHRYLVRVTGYPDSAQAPVTCLNRTSRQSVTQLRFACGGYPDGTSGSPWGTNFDQRTRTATIVGVIGGYQLGGDTSAVSYSSYFGPAVQQLYEQASK